MSDVDPVPAEPGRRRSGPGGGGSRWAGGEEVDVAPVAMALSSRVAEDMFWLGRYAERAEDVARLLRVAADLAVDHSGRPGSVGAAGLGVMLRSLTGVTTTYPGFIEDGAEQRLAAPQPELIRLAVDSFRAGTLAHAVRHTVDSAHAVRELLSGDTWLVLGSLDRVLAELGRAADPDLQLQATLSRVLEGLLALSGLAVESMVRDSGWYLMDAGRRIERALQLVALLRHSLAEGRPPAVDELVLESVLISAESVITYRRRNPGRPTVDAVLALLLLDPGNPRGVQHQLDRLADDLGRLPGLHSDDGPQSRLPAVRALLREADLSALARTEARAEARSGARTETHSGARTEARSGARAETGTEARAEPEDPPAPARHPPERPRLVAFLDRLSFELADLADELARTYFVRAIPPQPMPATPTLDLR